MSWQKNEDKIMLLIEITHNVKNTNSNLENVYKKRVIYSDIMKIYYIILLY